MSRRSHEAVTLLNKPIEPQRYKGPFVYKYGNCKHLEWLKPIILEHKLYFPTPRQLNDPAEARPALASASEEALIQKLTEWNTERKAHLNTDEPANDAKIIAFNGRRFGANTLLKEMTRCLHPHLETFHIYSLSKRPNNKHLWMSYAAGHTGYCLEFRTEGTLERVFEVRHTDFAIDITDPDQIQPFFFFYKTKSWSREEEVRIITHRTPDPIAYFEPHLLTRAILGARSSQCTRLRSESGRLTVIPL